MLAAAARAAPAAALPALTPRRTAPRSMKFMKKLGLKKPEWLPDFGKPKEFSGSLKQVRQPGLGRPKATLSNSARYNEVVVGRW
jgi:hypothetical protein